MDRYHIALFLHLVALVIAASAAAVTKLAAGRGARARTLADALDWHNLLTSTAKLFPICLAVFVITGSYMLSFGQASVWTSGYVVAGLVGVVLLLASGVFLAIKGNSLKQVLERLALSGADNPPPRVAPPFLVVALPMINTGIALSVVFDMVTKPASVVVALAIVAVGIALPATMVMRTAHGVRREAQGPMRRAARRAE